jgi:hypothetical protein
MDKNLKISVNHLLEIFSGAINSLIPWLEKVEIEWLNGKSYDDWDKIVNSLYENIICSTLTGEVLTEYSIAKYDFEYSDYSQLDFIQVQCDDHNDKKCAFVSFKSISTPCDFVRVAIIDDFEKVLDYLDLPFNNSLEFRLIRFENGIKVKIKEVDILV